MSREKILTYPAPEGLYICCLASDDSVDCCFFRPEGKIVADRIKFSSMPPHIQFFFEEFIDPHHL